MFDVFFVALDIRGFASDGRNASIFEHKNSAQTHIKTQVTFT
jgi:hypothetical protein